jgi:hypothetical protein
MTQLVGITSARRASAALLAGLLLAALPAAAEEPLRLRLERNAGDVAAQGACVRGRLVLVRSFAQAGIWVADTLEVIENSGSGLPAGRHPATARGGAADGWRIEIDPLDAALRAQPESPAAPAAGSLLLGRRSRPANAGPCDLESDRLSDGTAVVRRLRRVYASPENTRPIELGVQP